jgi:hypothetical protein
MHMVSLAKKDLPLQRQMNACSSAPKMAFIGEKWSPRSSTFVYLTICKVNIWANDMSIWAIQGFQIYINTIIYCLAIQLANENFQELSTGLIDAYFSLS